MDRNLENYWNKRQMKIPLTKEASSYAAFVLSQINPGDIICDLGGGTGTDALFFARNNHPVKFFDISSYAITQIQEKIHRENLESIFTAEQLDFNTGKIPLLSNSIDVVYARLSLHYFNKEKTIELFQEIYRVLKKEGQAFITLKSPEDTVEMESLRSNATEIEPYVFADKNQLLSRFPITELSNMLNIAGIPVHRTELYKEKIDGKSDKTQFGNTDLLLNEITFKKE